jgi:PHD/YefM family antitoxin component YafN of YafNO toxin-antitoxin module
MSAYSQTAEIIRSMVSVSRFNRGEAAKIFDEVEQTGIKIAVKNNKPACILISPQKYKMMVEEIEDLYLLIEAEKRISETDIEYSFESVLADNGMTLSDVDAMDDVEIE